MRQTSFGADIEPLPIYKKGWPKRRLITKPAWVGWEGDGDARIAEALMGREKRTSKLKNDQKARGELMGHSRKLRKRSLKNPLKNKAWKSMHTSVGIKLRTEKSSDRVLQGRITADAILGLLAERGGNDRQGVNSQPREPFRIRRGRLMEATHQGKRQDASAKK